MLLESLISLQPHQLDAVVRDDELEDVLKAAIAEGVALMAESWYSSEKMKLWMLWLDCPMATTLRAMADQPLKSRVIILLADVVIENNNDRIAQMILTPVVKMELEEIESLPETIRGEGGFGSTGK